MKPNVYRNPASGGPGRSGADPTDPEAIVRVVLEKSPLLIYIANLDYKIVLANRALREVTGYDTGDCPNVEALIEHFYPHGDTYAQRVRDIHEGWRRNEHIMGAKLLVQCKDGGQRTVAWYTSRLRIGKSPTIGYIAMGLDVTTQGTLEQWIGLLQRTLQHLTEGVVLTDATGLILAWNAGATGLLGHTEETMQGQPLNNLFVRGEREIVARSIDEAVSGERARFQAELELNTSRGGSELLSFVQHRLDGEGGVPLARLTVLTPAGSAEEDAAARAKELEAELRTSMASNSELQGEISSLHARVSALDASLATHEAAAGQIADLRGQLDIAEEATSDATTKIATLVAELASEKDAHVGDVTATSQELDATRVRAEAAAAKATALEERVAALEKDLKSAKDSQAAADAAQKTAEEALEAAKKEATDALEAAKKESADALEAAKKESADALAATQKKAEADAEAAQKKADKALTAAQKKAETDAEAAQKKADDALAKAQEEAQAAAKEAKEAQEAAAKEAKDSAAATAKQLAAKAKEAAAEAKKATELEKKLTETSEELGKTKSRLEELESLTKDGGARLDELKAKLEESEAALDKAEEEWGNERGRIQEAHRTEMEALAKKAAKDRKSLEDQLHKDILAAEERSEVELAKISEKYDKERKDLEQAAEIAQAEIESAAQQSVQEYKTKLEQLPSLEDHVATVAELAVVSADTSGRVLAWSTGAGALDGRKAADAVGKVIHEDVLQLEGVAWKTLFGKIMIKGGIQQEVTLITASGAKRQVELRASLVKNAQGAPIGLTEVLRLPEVGGEVGLHAAAALGRLVKPVQEMLDVRTLAGLAASDEAVRSARGLVRLAETVVAGASLADIESVARAENLVDSLDTAEASLQSQSLTWREIRMTLQDLDQIQAGVTGGRISWRWNELVERCLHASGAERANRQYGEAGAFAGSGEAVVPLLLGLLGDASDRGSGLTLATGQDNGKLNVSIVGGSWSSDDKRLAAWLAGEAGGEVSFTGAIAKVAVPAGQIKVEGSAPTLLSYSAAQLAEVGKISETDKTEGTEEILSVEAEEMDEDEELDLELDEGPTGPVDDRSTLEMAGLSDLDVAAAEEEDDDDLPSDHPVLASGSVDLMEEGDGDDLMVMAGEDSVIKSADVVYMAIRSIDDADPVLGQSEAMLARQGEAVPMSSGSGEDPITQSELEPLLALQEIAEGTVEKTPAAPPKVAEEMKSTDSGDGAMAAAPKAAPKKSTRRKPPARGRKRKRKRSPRNKK